MKKLIAISLASLWMAMAGFAQTTVHTATQDAAGGNTFTQRNVFVGPLNYYVDTGAANAYVIATGCGPSNAVCPAALTSLSAGAMFSFKATNGNTGGSTLAVDSVTAIAIQLNGSALSSGSIVAGHVYTVTYNGTNFDLVGSGGGGGGSPAFSAVTPGTNTGALLMGSGGSFGPTGSGTVTANGASGSLATQIAPNTNAFYLSQNCGTQTNCTAVVSGHIAVNATFTSATDTLTTASTDPAFTCPGGTFPCSSGGDVGAVEFATYGCAASNPMQCDSANAQGTISSIQSAHAATVSSNFTHSSTSNTGQNANDFIWGPLEDTPISTAWSAAEALGGGTVVLPCNATLLISTPPFIRASATGPVQAMDVLGCASTNLVPVPNFSLSSCNNGCIYFDAVAPGNNYANGGASRQPTVRDLSVFGGGYDCTGCSLPGGAVAAIYLNNQSAYNVNITGWDWNIAAFVGFDGGNLASFINSTSYAVGGIGCSGINSSNEGGVFYVSTLCNSNTAGLKVTTGQVFTNDSTFYEFGANGQAYFVTGGTAFSTNDFIFGTAYVDGGVGHFSNDYVGGADLGGSGGFYVRLTGSKAYLENVWDNGGAGFTMGDSGGGTPVMYDLGGNVSTAAVNIASGNLFGSASVTGTVQTSGNISPSTGWGSGTVGTVSGASRAEQFTITTGASGQTANPTVTVTFPAAFWVTPICMVPPNAGNDLIADSVITATSKTAVTFQWNGTPNPSKTYTFTVQCQNP